MAAGVSMSDIDGWSRRQLADVEAALQAWVPAQAPAGLGVAMRYGVLDGGKRLRPLLVLAACDAAAGDRAAALRAAVAVELIHAYSLVHDDMPCMDNDTLRRGKPTVHVKFGQAQAMLAGDAMQALAFEVLTADPGLAPALQARLTSLLARAAGHAGMAGGQAIDLASIGRTLDEAALRDMHRRKTGALLQASVLMGAACGRTDPLPRLRWPTTATPSAWPSRWWTTSSTSPRPRRRWARPPARTSITTSPPTCRCSAWRPRGATPSTCACRRRPRWREAASGPPPGCCPRWPTRWWSAKVDMNTLLSKIQSPADLRRLSRAELQTVATELRQFVLNTVSQTGGHLGSNLGTVELTVALHYVFHTPHDRLVWDVGHQTYPHKVLTGRRDRMHSLRQLGGIGGFPRRDESEYDTFGTAHSSTSISAALGMARAAKLKGEDRRAVAIIGDGAMSAGMAFEALNNAGVSHAGVGADLLVVLNDNDMSISPPVGALNKYLARLMSGNFYEAAREGVKGVLKAAPPLFELARRFEEHAKGMVVPGTIFEEFGFNYVGPIDGHDLDSLIPTLENLRARRGPQFLHVVTRKGYGYKLAEADPVKYHAASGKFDPAEGFPKSAPSAPTFTQVFGQWLCDMAEADERLIGITPAMREGSGMVEFHRRFPERYHDVGIAEQHAVTFAAGLACEGLKPVVAIYSTFLQRGYDQLIHDVALQNLPVVFALDRAGLVGADGPTHAGAYDIAYRALHPELQHAHAERRERVPPGADHRLPPEPPGGGALPARRRGGCRHRVRPHRVALGPGRGATRMASGWRCWPSARCCMRR